MSEVTLDIANRMIEKAFAEARKLGLPPLAVAVLDSGGHLRAMQRQDNLSFLRSEICQAKAWGALALGADSRNLAQRFANDKLQRGFIQSLNAMSMGKLIPLPGGVLVRSKKGEILGAVGVAGAASEQDEACAVAAIHSVGFKVLAD